MSIFEYSYSNWVCWILLFSLVALKFLHLAHFGWNKIIFSWRIGLLLRKQANILCGDYMPLSLLCLSCCRIYL